MMIIPDIIEQHWEEAGILWARRCSAVDRPSYVLKTLTDLDERVEAHLDGLRVAGQEGWELCLEQTTWDDGGEAFALGILSFDDPDEGRFKEVVKQAVQKPTLVRGLASALGWMDARLVQTRIHKLLTSQSAPERAIGMNASAAHRLPMDGVLTEALKDGDGSLRALACQAVGELGRADLVRFLQPMVTSENLDDAFWSAWSLALLTGDSFALNRLRDFVAPGSARQWQAANVFFRRLPQSAALDIQRQLAKTPETGRLAIIAAGIIGDVALVPWVLDQMGNPKNLRLAADAFQTITGADFVLDRLRNGTPPRPRVAEDKGADQPDDDDDDLVWPNPGAIREWWAQRKARFMAGTRYLLGQPISAESLREVLRVGHQRQRAGAAVELAIRLPGQALFNVGAPGFRQQGALPGPAVR